MANETIESLTALCRENGRVCPMTQKCNQLWQMLPKRRPVGMGWKPALPLILAAWHDTPAMSKIARLAEHYFGG
jgi:hypothetical protein